jgi:hypothetical protein
MNRSISRPSIFRANVSEVPIRPKPIEVSQLIEGIVLYINTFEPFELYSFEIYSEKYDSAYESTILCFGDFYNVDHESNVLPEYTRKKLYIGDLNKKITKIDDKLYAIPFAIRLSLVWIGAHFDLVVIPIDDRKIEFRSILARSGNRVQVRSDNGAIEDILL